MNSNRHSTFHGFLVNAMHNDYHGKSSLSSNWPFQFHWDFIFYTHIGCMQNRFNEKTQLNFEVSHNFVNWLKLMTCSSLVFGMRPRRRNQHKKIQFLIDTMSHESFFYNKIDRRIRHRHPQKMSKIDWLKRTTIDWIFIEKECTSMQENLNKTKRYKHLLFECQKYMFFINFSEP